MATTMSIWNDKIVLYWEGRLHPREESKIVQSERAELGRTLKLEEEKKPQDKQRIVAIKRALSDEKILATHYSSITKKLLPHIHGFAKFSKRFGAFTLNFSQQNLKRIHNQFGQIKVTGGYDNIQKLKSSFVNYKSVVEKSLAIKSTASVEKLAELSGNIDYKVPPLGAYQHIGVSLLTSVPKFPLFADCGMGKSFMVLVSTEHQIKTGVLAPGKTLICGKLATLYSCWLEDAQKFTELKVSCLWVPGSYKRKEKILARLEEPADIYVINHDGIRSIHSELCAKRFDKVVIDESTILKSYHSDRKGAKGGSFGRAISEISANASWRVIMTGTPAANGVQDLWGQFRFLDPDGFLLEASYEDFRTRFMEERVFGRAGDRFAPRTFVQKPSAPAEIKDVIGPLIYRVRIRDHIKSLPPLTVMKRTLPMTAKQETHYANLALTLATNINDVELTSTISIVLISRFRQITGGFLYDYDKNPHPLEEGVVETVSGEGCWVPEDNPKFTMMDDLLNDEIPVDEKVVIFAQHNYEIQTILERYKQYNPVSVYGGNKASDNLANIDRFVKDEKVRLIVLHPKSAAHGITLTVARYMIFFSISFSEEENYQAIKRIERAVQKNAMFVYYLLCEESIDTVMFEALQGKKENQAKLLDPTPGYKGAPINLTALFKRHLQEKYPKGQY